MFVTIAEADVAPDREAELRAAWDSTTSGSVPPGLIESFLLRTEAGTWRIVTVWESEEAVRTMRASGAPPAAIVMFESAGAKPSVSLCTVEGRLDTN